MKQYYINKELPIIGKTVETTTNVVSVPVIIALQKDMKNMSIFAKLIKWWTKSKYFHVEIIVGNKWVSATTSNGVHIKELRPLSTDYEYIQLDNALLTQREYLDFNMWLKKQEGKKYDTLGILFSQIIPFRYDNRDKWFCSEIGTKILQLLSYKEVYDLYPHLAAPGDIPTAFGVER